MSITTQIIDLLNKPFQSETTAKKELISHFFIGLFVMLFLWFFQPFGLSEYSGNVLFIASLFGLATWVMGILFFLLTNYVLKIKQGEPSWTFFKWMIYVLCLILAIAFANFLIMGFLSGWRGMSIAFFLDLLIKTLAVGLFPVALSGIISLYKNEKKNLREASLIHLNKDLHEGNDSATIEIPALSGSGFACKQQDLLYLEASQNYVAIVHLGDSAEVSTKLIRNTLSAVHANLPADVFYQCHRSYIVNLNKIVAVSGNAQGLLVELDGCSTRIPVSRSFISEFRKRVNRN